MNTSESEFWNNVIKQYFSSAKPTSVSLSLYLREEELKKTLEFAELTKDKTVLDISSEPRFLDAISKNNDKITRIDFVSSYDNYIKKLIKERNISINKIYDPEFIITPEHVEFSDAQFDLIISIGTANYFPNVKDLFYFASKYLRRNGSFITSVKTELYPIPLTKRSETNRTYDAMKLNALFNSANLKIDKIKGICIGLPTFFSEPKFAKFVFPVVKPFISFNDALKRNVDFFLNKNCAWYYIIKATKVIE